MRPIKASTSSALRGCAVGLLMALCATGAWAAGGGEERTQAEIFKEMAWQALNLAILLGVLIHFGRKPIKNFFATRREGIQTELDQAAALLAQAEQRNAELQRRLVDLNTEVEGIKKVAGQRAQDEADRILADARAAADRIRKDAKAAIDQELRRARVELREEAADLALEIAAQKLQEEVGDGDRERLVDEFILRVEPGAADGSGPSGGANP